MIFFNAFGENEWGKNTSGNSIRHHPRADGESWEQDEALWRRSWACVCERDSEWRITSVLHPEMIISVLFSHCCAVILSGCVMLCLPNRNYWNIISPDVLLAILCLPDTLTVSKSQTFHIMYWNVLLALWEKDEQRHECGYPKMLFGGVGHCFIGIVLRICLKRLHLLTLVNYIS